MTTEVATKEAIIDKEKEIYEVSYLIVPIVDESGMTKFVDNIKSTLSKKDGTILNEGKAKMIDLSYVIEKGVSNKKQTFSSAYFGWIKIEIPSVEIDKFKNDVEKIEGVIRFLIVKSPKDMPIPERQRPVLRKRPQVKRVEKKEERKPVDEAQLDKEIEELLTT